MKKAPKPVDREHGGEVEAAPLLETEERSHWAGSEETRKQEAETKSKLTSSADSNKRIAPEVERGTGESRTVAEAVKQYKRLGL